MDDIEPQSDIVYNKHLKEGLARKEFKMKKVIKE